MGQGKSPFRAEVSEVKAGKEPPSPAAHIHQGFVYAQSDVYCTDHIKALYHMCRFVCAGGRIHRTFKENYLDRRDSAAAQLIRAGSIFLPKNAEEFMAKLRNPHAEMAGFNKLIKGEKSQ